MSRAVALDTLQELADKYETDFDADLEGKFLTLTHSKGQFLVNYHPTLNQLWLSSPVSGAHHFSYCDKKWICTRSGQHLQDVLEKDLYA